MNNDMLARASCLSDVDLLARLPLLAAHARESTVELVAHLAELEARKLYLSEGYGSPFEYCTIALRLSEHAAYNRLAAARVVRRFPAILVGLADGSLNLTTVRLIGPLLSMENHKDVLGRAAGRSKRDVEALVAALAPRADVAPSIRKMSTVRGAETSGVAGHASTLPELTPTAARTAIATAKTEVAGDAASPVPILPVHQPPVPRPVITPLSPTRYRLQCTIGEEAHANLRLAQDLLRREIPSGDPGVIVERALVLLLAQVAKDKIAETAKPGTVRPTVSGSRHIPASVKRAVWLRDRGQCAFVARLGRRCTQRAFLEFHHVEPYAVGGEATVRNISLRCRRHNAHEAELVFGTRLGARAETTGRGASAQPLS